MILNAVFDQVWISARCPITTSAPFCHVGLSVAILRSTGPGQLTNPQHMFHALGILSSPLLSSTLISHWCYFTCCYYFCICRQKRRRKGRKKEKKSRLSESLIKQQRAHLWVWPCVIRCKCSCASCLFVRSVDVTTFTVTVEGADEGEGL